MKKTISLVLVLALGLATGVANADFTFGEPENLGPTVNTSYGDSAASISADGLSLYFCDVPYNPTPAGHGGGDLWVTTRDTTDDEWGTRMNLGTTVNTSSGDGSPCMSADGLSLYFSSDRPGGYGNYDLWMSTRTTTKDDWSAPVNLGPTVNSSADETFSSISADGLQLYFAEWQVARPGGYGSADLWVTTRPTKDDSWGTPTNLGPTINTSVSDNNPCISDDGLSLYFTSYRPGGLGGEDIWVTRRATVSDPWAQPVNLGPPINSLAHDALPNFSADGSTLYFSSRRPGGFGGYDLWQAPILPTIDFNGDGIVNATDMCIIVDHWGEDYSLCDIGPTPLGDGIVDVQDLIVLAEHLFEEVDDPTLIAHWALDETEGDIASDIANDNDGTVYGDPAWQPQGGIVDGALLLDGIDDYGSTPFVLNPADGKFSVFAWIKGGAPGQAVLSQIGGVNWLCADILEGNLMTELKGSGRGAAALLSQAVITDDEWHRIGFVWDGSHRTLYVDDVAVAEDTQTDLEASENGLYIGTGKATGNAMGAGTYWSGLIDDVRIYNRAVIP